MLFPIKLNNSNEIYQLYKTETKSFSEENLFSKDYYFNIFKSKLNGKTDVAVKKIVNSNRSSEYVRFRTCFINEIINSQKLEEEKKSKKKEKIPYFTEYLGFVLFSDINYEYFGSIITKWYELGTLADYQLNLSKNELVDLASQIARGKQIKNIYRKHSQLEICFYQKGYFYFRGNNS